MAEKEVTTTPTTAKVSTRTIESDIDALTARIEKESKSPKKRYALRFLRYAKGNL